MVKKLLLLCVLLQTALSLKAQVPDPCPSDDFPAADICEDACIYCNFNGYTGTTSGYTGQTPAGFCGTIENEQWLGFIAGGTAATFTATASNCDIGNGVQIALYQTCSGTPVPNGCNADCEKIPHPSRPNGDHRPVIRPPAPHHAEIFCPSIGCEALHRGCQVKNIEKQGFYPLQEVRHAQYCHGAAQVVG